MSDDKKNPRQPLSKQLGPYGAITFVLLGVMVIGPLLFGPEVSGLFHLGTMLVDGVCALVGYALGYLIGRLIEGPPSNE